VVAAAINLRREDLPGFSATPRPITPTFRAELADESRCPGGTGHPRLLASSFSDSFRSGSGANGVTIVSSVRVRPTPAAVSRDLVPKPSTDKGCLARALRRLLAPYYRVLGVLVVPLDVRTPRWSRTLAYEAILGARPRGRSAVLRVYADSVGFAYGQDEIELTALSASQPFSPATEQALIGLMLERAKTHPR
jgi:hypothetical protein